MATTEIKILDYTQLKNYDAKIKAKMSTDDAKVLADAKLYSDGLAENYEPAGAVVTLANGQVKTNTDNISALENLVGTIPEGYTSTTISDYAKELADAVAANGYDDTALKSRVTANENAIETLNGTGVGSVSKAVADVKTELTTEIDNKADKASTLSGYGIVDAYTATETDSAIATAVANADHLKRAIVDALPTVNSADSNTIYMVAKTTGNGEQNYDEYMLVNGAFEKIGDSTVDLTDYATKTDVINAKSEAISTAATDATTKANQALADAKTYADGKDASIAAAKASGDNAQADVDALELKVGTVTEGKTVVEMIADAEYDDTSLSNRVAVLESTTYTEITAEEIDALFSTLSA